MISFFKKNNNEVKVMKKSFLLILASLFAIFALAGCADDSKNDTPVVTGTVPTDLAGTYNVTFFGSQVTNPQGFSMGGQDMSAITSLYYISNDCNGAKELYPDIVDTTGESAGTAGMAQNWCDPNGTQSTILDGKAVITIDNGVMNITSRMQMEGGALTMSPADKYQYTIYNETADLTNFKGTGVTGWNYDAANNAPSANSTEYPESPFQVSKLDNGSIRIDMTLVGKNVNVLNGMMSGTVDAKTTVILEKVSNDTTALENALQAEFTPSEGGF